MEPYPTCSNKGTFPFLEYVCRHVLELFPQLHSTRVLRHWTGLCNMSSDYSPIMGVTEVDRDRQDARADRAFRLERFATDTLVSELAAAAVSH